MADLPSRADLYAIGRAFVQTRATKLDPGIIDVEGSDANIFVGSASVLASAVITQLAFRAAALTLDGAFGEDLDRLAWDRYRLVRKGASPAVVPVVLFRATAAAGSGTVPIGTKLTTLLGSEYVTTSSATFGVSSVNAVATSRAVQAGKATQVGARQITRYSKPGTLFDPSLQVVNLVASAGGEDAEDDATFKNRIRQFWNTVRRGVLSAIVFGALQVPGVVSASAIEEVTQNGLPARLVKLTISDSSGISNATLAAAVRTNLTDFRAAGIAVLVSSSVPTMVEVQLSLQFQSTVDTTTLADAVRAAVVSFINSLPVNGTLYLSDLYSVLRQFVSDGLIVPQGTVVAPAGDVVPGAGQTLRTTLDRVTLVLG